MEKVAITGGAGFLGSHIVRHEMAKGNELVIIDNFSSGSVENLTDQGVKQNCVVGDLRNYDFAREALANVDTVFHFAAEVGSVEYLHGSGERDLDALQTNSVIDANVFKACRQNRASCLIYASSAAVYPFERQSKHRTAFGEDDAIRHVNPEGGYGWSKILGEIQLRMMSDVSVGIARIFHTYGKNMYIKPDRSQVIASLIRKAVRYPREDFIVWGDGTQRRCFVFVDDVLEALDTLEEYVKQKGSLTVNLGSEEEVTIKELAEQIIGLSGKSIEPIFDISKPIGVSSRRPDLKRIKNTLGWTPKTNLTDGLARTFDWEVRRLATHYETAGLM